jgi:ribosome maturation factor RimP
MDIADRVKALVDNYLQQNGIELVEIMYKRQSGGMVLRLLVDTPQGISIDECERLNNYLSELLDKEDVIPDSYTLEVASPGLDRPIATDRDFERAMGRTLEVTTYEPIDMRKTHEGILIGMDKEKIVIESRGISVVIPRDKIARARLRVEFDR